MFLGKPGSPYYLCSLSLVLGFPMAKVECPYDFLDVPQALPTQQAPCQVITPGTLLPLLSTLLVCACPHMCSCAQESNLAATLDFCGSFTTHINNSQLIDFSFQSV